MTPTFVKYGKIVTKRKRSLRVQFDEEPRTTVIPDALWYYNQYKVGDKENSLVVWDGPAQGSPITIAATGETELLPAAQAAAEFGVKVKDLRRWLRSGKVKGHQRQGLWLVDAQSLGQFMADR